MIGGEEKIVHHDACVCARVCAVLNLIPQVLLAISALRFECVAFFGEGSRGQSGSAFLEISGSVLNSSE